MKRILLVLLFTLFAITLKTYGITSQQLEANIRAATTGAGPTDFPIAPPAVGTGEVVSVATFGASPGNTGAANYTAFLNAITYCKNNNAYKLIVPTGVYHIGNYGSSYTANLYFNGFTDFIFDGQGSEFLFESKSPFIRLQSCQRMEVQNVTSDWNWALEPVQSLGKINAIDPNGNYIDLLFPYESNPSASAGVYEIVEVDGTNFNCSHNGMGVLGAWRMDFSKTTKPAGNVIRYFQDSTVNGNGWFHSQNVQVGQYYVTRHYSYEHHGVMGDDSNDITFTNTTLYSTLGMGYVFHNNHHYQIIDSKIIRRPGSIWHYSSAADGIHVANSFGFLKIQNVELGNAGDDAINIHDAVSQGITVTGTRTLIAKQAISWRNPFDVGSAIELRQKDFTPVGFSSAVVSRTYNDGASQCTITFANDLPAGLDPNTILFNTHFNSGNYIVRNCSVHDNKVRGLIVHCRNGTIENNQFLRNCNPGMFVMTVATKYQEGMNPNNIIIRNNIFDGNDIYRNNFPSMPNNVLIAAETTTSGIVSYPMCQNIIFENNTIMNCPYGAFSVASAKNVLVKNNTIVNPNLFNNLAGIAGSMIVAKSSDIVLNNNTLIVDAGVTAYKTNVYVDTATANVDIFVDPFSRPVNAGWSSQDVGAVGVAGSSSYGSGTYTLNGAGADVWGTADSFHYFYQPWGGDGEIVVRVATVENTDPWAKAGLMYRETLSGDSAHGFLFVTPANGVSLQGRTVTGGSSAGVNTVTGIAPPRWLKLVRAGNNLSGYQSADGTTWIFVGTQTNAMTVNIYVGLVVTAKNNATLNTSTFDHLTINRPWFNQDIGSVGVAGSSQIAYSSGVISSSGSGADIWGTADSFQYLYQSSSGDGQIVARVTNVGNTDPWAKAAIMIRESLAANSRHAVLFLTPTNGVNLQGRTTTDGSSTSIAAVPGLTAPRWLKLERSGSRLNGYQSADGVNWTWVGTQTNAISTSYFIGMAVTSKNNAILSTSTFDNVSISEPWTNDGVGSLGIAGSAQINDTTGSIVVGGSGSDIWSTVDSFQYVNQPLYGNGEIVARVAAIQNSDPWAKAGIMLRESLAANARNTVVFVTPVNGVSLQGRTASGGNTTTVNTIAGLAAPRWLKLSRNGSSVSAYHSNDGVSWTLVGTQSNTMTSKAMIGIVVSSKNNSILNTSTFDSIIVNPMP